MYSINAPSLLQKAEGALVNLTGQNFGFSEIILALGCILVLTVIYKSPFWGAR